MAGIGYRAVRADAWFTIRILRQLDSLGDAGALVPTVMAPWWSMYLHEGRSFLARELPQLRTEMSLDAAEVFERSRHGLKMFLDTKRNVDGYEQYFARIEDAHQERFIGSVWRPLRRLGRDLGLTTYKERLIGTTHGYAFASGLEPEAVRSEMGPRLRNLWEEAGGSFAMAALAVDGPAPAVVRGWQESDFAFRDVVSSEHYRSVFTGDDHPNLNAVLLHYLGMVNAVDLLFPYVHDVEDEVEQYAIFKMRFVLTAHVVGSLRKLAGEGRSFSASSAAHLQHLVDAVPEGSLLSLQWLRNLLVHYAPNSKSNASKAEGVPLLDGVLAVSETSRSLEEVAAGTTRNLRHLSQGLGDWMQAPSD